MTLTRVRLGISTCPNDTYAFAGLLLGAVETEGLSFETTLLDIAELNRRALASGDDALDVAKVSFHAALSMTERRVVLPVGSALGFGVGPLLLAAQAGRAARLAQGAASGARVLCPGPDTTATMLYRLFYPDGPEPEHVVFSEIMPALKAGEADFGVCIHEGRFTYADEGLHCVQDLGKRWETTTDSPLPLGGLVADRALGNETLGRISRAVSRSLAFSDAHPAQALQVMREHAQELDDDVIWQHVELYVNAQTRDLGTPGRRALSTLFRTAAEAGVVPSTAHPLEVHG